jgi:hypothetical protein
METVVGVFRSREDAVGATRRLRAAGVGADRINLFFPGATPEELTREVPTTGGEQRGMGKVIGGTLGGGVAAGVAATMLIPGIGPVTAIGLAAGALLTAGGILGGAAAGGAVENALTDGLPADELVVYEDALQKGRSVLFVLAQDEAEATVSRRLLAEGGAESLDAAREEWWVGLRKPEEAHYAADGGDFARDERLYRRGFEAALRMRGRPFAEATAAPLGEIAPDEAAQEAFRRGYERGCSWPDRRRGDRPAR